MPTVLVAMTLAGCGASGKYVKGNGFSFIARWIQFFGDSQTDFAFGVNSYIGQLAFKVNSFLSDHIVDQAKTAYGGFSKYVTIFQWIALAYILIKFGQLIFQNYFTENQKYAQNSVSILKKLVICFALVWAMPYAVFTGYFVSTEAGFTVSQQIANADTAFISKASGVGKKSAERVIVDLRDKVGIPSHYGATATKYTTAADANDEALDALMALGFSLKEASLALEKVDKSLPTEERIKLALKK